MKCYISIPPGDSLEDDISEYYKIKHFLEMSGYEVPKCASYPFSSTASDDEIATLIAALQGISVCKAVCMGPGWEKPFKCFIEYQVAKYYGRQIIFYEVLDGKERLLFDYQY